MSITRRKLAPYAKQFIQHDPELPLAWLYFGPAAWDGRKELNSRSVILPPHENPAHYDWRILKDQIVIAHAMGNTDTKHRKRLAIELLLAGVKQIEMILPTQQQQVEMGNTVKYMEMVTPHERYFRD
jgi:hypothetical protein